MNQESSMCCSVVSIHYSVKGSTLCVIKMNKPDHVCIDIGTFWQSLIVCAELLEHNVFYALNAFSVLTLLVGQQEEHMACKKLSGEILAWLSVWSEVQMICIWSG